MRKSLIAATHEGVYSIFPHTSRKTALPNTMQIPITSIILGFMLLSMELYYIYYTAQRISNQLEKAIRDYPISSCEDDRT